MAYTKSLRTIEPRSPDLAYDELGAGLYEDETLFELDTGEEVAVSVKATRFGNGSGLEVIGWVRWIEEDGTTRLDSGGNELEGEYRHSFPIGQVEALGVPALCKSVLLIMLGEEPELVEVNPSDEVRYNASIRCAIATANATANPLDTGDLL